MNVHSRWDEAVHDEACIAWARAFYKDSEPHALPGAYVNFLTGDEQDLTGTAYGSNQLKLAEIKQQYDPENVFHINHNITPKA